MDYRRMFDDKDHLYAYDLEGRERTLEIERVVAGELTGEKNRKSKKPMISFIGERKKLAVNKTNGKIIAKLYGYDTDRWVGQLITLYPTTTEFGGETVDCIRVRPNRPEHGNSPRSDQRRDRSGATRGRGSAGKPDQSSAIAARYLIDRYAQANQADLAELKIERARSWDTLTAEDREAVIAAAKAAGERLGVIGAAAVSDGAPATVDRDDEGETVDDADGGTDGE